jgi:hypothetical protein
MMVLVGGLVGCGSSELSEPSEPSGSSRGSSAGSAPSVSAEPSKVAAADGTDVSVCADGVCEILVTDTVLVPMERFGYKEFRVTVVPPRRVAFLGTDSQGRLSLGAEVGTGGQLGSGQLVINVRSVTEEGAVLSFSLA